MQSVKEVDLFQLFDANLYGPEPKEEIDLEGLHFTLLTLDLDPEDSHVMAQFKRWWWYHGGLLAEEAPLDYDLG